MNETSYTLKQAKNNAQPYKNYYIGTISIRGDSRYVVVLFDNDFNVLEQSICGVKDMQKYVDSLEVKE